MAKTRAAVKRKSRYKGSTKSLARRNSKKQKPEPQEFPISHAMLRTMYDAMVESRAWAHSQNLVPAISEATAVPAALILHKGDVLAAPPDGRTLYPVTERSAEVISLDSGRIREACQSARRKRRGVVVAICSETVFDAGPFQELLRESLQRRWPLATVLLSDRFYDPASPITEIDVDGHDAVAMFRVIGESIRRARNQRGPAVVHAHNSTATEHRDPLGDPLVRFQRYLVAKGLTTEGLHVLHQGVEETL